MSAVSRIAALSLTLAVPVVAVGLGALPIARSFDRLNTDIAELTAQRDAFAARRARAEAPRPISVTEPALISAATEALAAAKMQDLIAAATARAGADLNSRRVDKAIAAERWRKLPMAIDVTVPEGALHKLLHALESQRPYVFVETLDIRRARQGSPDDKARTLVLRIVLYSLMPPGP